MIENMMQIQNSLFIMNGMIELALSNALHVFLQRDGWVQCGGSSLSTFLISR
jgi:hypothetical protein